jgi:hypothetical protein
MLPGRARTFRNKHESAQAATFSQLAQALPGAGQRPRVGRRQGEFAALGALNQFMQLLQ